MTSAQCMLGYSAACFNPERQRVVEEEEERDEWDSSDISKTDMSSRVPRIPPPGETLALNIAVITGLLPPWMKGKWFMITAGVFQFISARWDVKCVWNIDSYGQIKSSPRLFSKLSLPVPSRTLSSRDPVRVVLLWTEEKDVQVTEFGVAV